MMNSKLKLCPLAGALIVAGSFISGSGAFEITETGIELAPMQQPAERHVGDRWVQLKNSTEEITTELISSTYATHTFRNSDECIVTRRKGTRFTPYVSCICPSGNGTNTVRKNGDPWPLETGKVWSYDVNGKDGDGAQWAYELACEVEDTAVVKTARVCMTRIRLPALTSGVRKPSLLLQVLASKFFREQRG